MQYDQDDRDRDGGDRNRQVANVLGKVVGVAVVIGLVIGLGTLGIVKGLGLNDAGEKTAAGAAVPGSSDSPLPTSALPVPDQHAPSDAGSGGTGLTPSPDPGNGKLQLTATPATVRPNERINLTGRYPGKDSVELKVQRFDSGSWTDFPVTASVHLGTYETYVMTGRQGDQRFRMFDPRANKGSNPVTVTVS